MHIMPSISESWSQIKLFLLLNYRTSLMIEVPVCTDCRDVVEAKTVCRWQKVWALNRSIQVWVLALRHRGFWILNVAQDVFLLMFTFVKLFKEFWDAIYFSKFCVFIRRWNADASLGFATSHGMNPYNRLSIVSTLTVSVCICALSTEFLCKNMCTPILQLSLYNPH